MSWRVSLTMMMRGGAREKMSELHNCTPEGSDTFPRKDNGHAISFCLSDREGRLWVSGGSYTTQVNYCPFCGFKARVQVEWEPDVHFPLLAAVHPDKLDEPVEFWNPFVSLWIKPAQTRNADGGVEAVKRQIDTGEIQKCDLCNKHPMGSVAVQGGILALCGEHFRDVTTLYPQFCDGGINALAEFLKTGTVE